MKPTEKLGTATAPDGQVITLYRHDGAYLMVVDGIELMSTRRRHSEEALATIPCERLAGTTAPAVLIGGLGFGFTLRTALALLPHDARVVVAELVPEVVEWNRNTEWPLAADALRDPRTTLLRDDVANVLRNQTGGFDAILLDVDNGAESFTTGSNRHLYAERGIKAAIAALRPGGRLAYWSVDSEPAFVKLLKRLGLTVAVHQVRSHSTSGGFNSIIVAHRAGE